MSVPFDYAFVQGLINDGKSFAANIVGQPFIQYRINSRSVGNIIAPLNQINTDIRAKIVHRRSTLQVENDVLKTNTFEFMMANDSVNIGDILVQNDPVYDGDSRYAVVSRRPLKAVVCGRVESDCIITRPSSAHSTAGYNGSTILTERPFVLSGGVYSLGNAGDIPAVIPCGIETIAQVKGRKPENLPDSTMPSWWYIFVPLLPGLSLLTENDIVTHQYDPGTPAVRYRVQIPYITPDGAAGQFLVCTKEMI